MEVMMGKIRRLKFILSAAVIVFGLTIIGIHIAQAQVKVAKKPGTPPGQDRPPEYEWNVVIVDGPHALLGSTGAEVYSGEGGQGLLYDCTEPNIYFHMRVVGPVQDQYRTSSRFELYYPDFNQGETLYQVDFTEYLQVWADTAYHTVDFPSYLDPILNPDFAYQPGRFPVCGDPGIDCSLPTCMFDFMKNWSHPLPGYTKISIDFYTGWFIDQVQADFSQWSEGDRKNIALGIEIHPIGQDGPYSPSEYNGIGFHTGNATNEYGYIEKIASSNPETTDIWRVVFGRDIYDIPFNTIGDQNITFDEWYWDTYLVQFNKKKTREETSIFYPTFADGDIQFELIFIRVKK
jgi:hypothetical protein